MRRFRPATQGKAKQSRKKGIPYSNGRCRTTEKTDRGGYRHNSVELEGSGQGGRDELTCPTKGNLWIDDKVFQPCR